MNKNEKIGTNAKPLNDAERIRVAQRCTWIGFAGNGLLSFLKILAGFVANSSAMIADGVHSISDFLTDAVVIVFVGVSGRGVNEVYHYGHGKFETFATFIISVLLALVAVGLFWTGGTKVLATFQGERIEAPGYFALVMAIVSILAKEAMFRYTHHVGVNIKSQALEANAWHHRSDALSSIATLAGIGGAIFLGENWSILDPLACIAVSVFIVIVAWKLGKPAVQELLEVSLPEEELNSIGQAIMSVNDVRAYHNLRCRHNGNVHIVDFHIKIEGNLTVIQAHDIATEVEMKLREQLGNVIANVHIEPYMGETIDADGRCNDSEKMTNL